MLTTLRLLPSLCPTLGLLVLVSSSAAGLVAAGSMLATLLRQQRSRSARMLLSVLPVALFILFGVGLALLVGGARAHFVHVAIAGLEDQPALGSLGMDELKAMYAGALLALVVGPGVMIAAGLPWVLAPGEGGATRVACGVVAITSSVLVAATALGVLGFTADLLLDAAPMTGAFGYHSEVVRQMGAASSALTVARVAVVVVGVVGGVAAVALAVRAARNGPILSGAGLAGTSVVLLLGVGCFFGTRALRWDGAHPIPARASTMLPPSPGVQPPRIAACEDGPEVPLMVVRRDGIELDGDSVTPTAMARRLAQYKVVRAILHPGQPARMDIGIVASGSTNLAPMVPWLRIIERSEIGPVDVMIERPTAFETRTLGRIERHTACKVTFGFDPGGTPITRYATWRDLARATAAAHGRLHIAL